MSQEKPITHKTHNKTEADGIQTGNRDYATIKQKH